LHHPGDAHSAVSVTFEGYGSELDRVLFGSRILTTRRSAQAKGHGWIPNGQAIGTFRKENAVADQLREATVEAVQDLNF
jgi:hypothetical protein